MQSLGHVKYSKTLLLRAAALRFNNYFFVAPGIRGLQSIGGLPCINTGCGLAVEVPLCRATENLDSRGLQRLGGLPCSKTSLLRAAVLRSNYLFIALLENLSLRGLHSFAGLPCTKTLLLRAAGSRFNYLFVALMEKLRLTGLQSLGGLPCRKTLRLRAVVCGLITFL